MKKFFILLFISILLTSNVSAGTDGENSLSKKSPGDVRDCFESVNRATFAFNQGLDKAIFKPVASVYKKLPRPIRKGSGNFVNNLSNLVTIPNNILQGDLKSAGTNLGRFAVNTTIGILGLFDVAQGLGFSEYRKEDYGQSLGAAGVGEGCYLVLPIFGPSTARDAVGTVANLMGGDPWYNITVKNSTNYVKDSDYYWSRGAAGVDFRAKNMESFDSLENNSMDFYASIRSLYLQDRQQKIANSNKIINTQNDSDWEEIETK